MSAPPPKRPRKTGQLGMLIGGGVTLSIGVTNLVFGGMELTNGDKGLGIATTVIGGVSSFFGLIFTIFGAVNVGKYGAGVGATSHPFIARITPTANGLAFQF